MQVHNRLENNNTNIIEYTVYMISKNLGLPPKHMPVAKYSKGARNYFWNEHY